MLIVNKHWKQSMHIMKHHSTTSEMQLCWKHWHRDKMHDDVIKWKHFPRYWPYVWGIHCSLVNSPHKGHWRGALMFSLICVWINCWVNNREAGDLRRYSAHYDVTVMGCHSIDDIFKCVFLNGNVWTSIKSALKFVSLCQIDNKPSLVQIMTCCRACSSHYLNQCWSNLLNHMS